MVQWNIVIISELPLKLSWSITKDCILKITSPTSLTGFRFGAFTGQHVVGGKLSVFDFSTLHYKHCQRHNGPEGWVLLTRETSSYTYLDQIPIFKISTKHHHFDQTLTSNFWRNINFITLPSLSSKILTKLQFQNFAWTSTPNS